MSSDIDIFQIHAVSDTKYGFFKKIGETSSTTTNIPIGIYMITSDIDALLYIYVLSKKDILGCGLNLPMFKVILIKDNNHVCNVWLHFNTTEKLNITADNFDEYVERKMEGYFSVDVYKHDGSMHITLETSDTFIGPKKAANHVIDLILSNIHNILDS